MVSAGMGGPSSMGEPLPLVIRPSRHEPARYAQRAARKGDTDARGVDSLGALEQLDDGETAIRVHDDAVAPLRRRPT
ncbi:hypothetical protein ACU686_09265 [Yinghuangia aomiensis]